MSNLKLGLSTQLEFSEFDEDGEMRVMMFKFAVGAAKTWINREEAQKIVEHLQNELNKTESECIPYNGNEHPLGTNDSPK